MLEKIHKKTETYFEEKWLDKCTYEETCLLSESIDNSRIEQDLPSLTANNKGKNLEIKIRVPKGDFSGKFGSSQILSKWEGVVSRVSGDIFMGKLRDLTTDEGFINEAEFSVDDLQEDDKELLEIGAVFYWYVGYMTTSGGTRTKISLLKFQRLPKWQKSKIERIEEDAKRLREKLKWI